MRDVKASSSRWINEKGLTNTTFRWQEGFGAFTYNKAQLPGVIAYIKNQKEHHQHATFKDEYLGFLEHHAIDYKEEYLFDWLSN